ncbi:hypothetical protein WA158_006053 [Blastocystis sp. Blastoise]
MGKKGEIPVYYTKCLEGSESPEIGLGPIYRSNVPAENLEDAKEYGFTSLYDQFLKTTEKFLERECLGYRPMKDGVAQDFTFYTYQEVRDMIAGLGSSMKKLNLISENDDSNLHCSDGEHCRLVGIYSRSRYEWIISEYACYYTNSAVVTLYDSLGPESSAYIFNITNMETVFVAGENELKNIIGMMKQEAKLKIKHIISYEPISDELKEEARALQLNMYDFHTLIEDGKKSIIPPNNTQYDDICTVCFTSGTTACPKGVILTHGNMLSLNISINQLWTCRFTENDVYLAYLPLAHVFERFIEANAFTNGSKIGYYQGDIKKIVDDLRALRPTVFCSVPRLLNRIYNILNSNVEKQSGLKKWLFRTAYNAKKNNLLYNQVTHSLFDRLIFKSIAAKVGFDRIRWFLNGSAPLADDISEFFKIIFSAPMMNGYGMTECCGGGICTCPYDFMTVGHCGAPVDSLEIRLFNVPEKGYSYLDKEHTVNKDGNATTIAIKGRGEVCMHGASVFQGYYKEDALNKQVFDSLGWFHTGDIAYVREDNGAVQIIDRIKNIFKLSQGEYISVEKVENIYLLNSLIEQIFIYGDSYQSYIVGVIVPNKQQLCSLLINNDLVKEEKEFDDYEELCKKPEIRKFILEYVNKTAVENGLFGFERIRNVYIESEPWSVENNFLTPSMKLKRNLTTEKYHGDIAIMYKEGQLL